MPYRNINTFPRMIHKLKVPLSQVLTILQNKVAIFIEIVNKKWQKNYETQPKHKLICWFATPLHTAFRKDDYAN